MADYILKESQRFNQVLIWIPVVSVTLILLGLSFLLPDKSVDWFDLFITFLILGSAVLFLLSFRLEIRIDGKSLQYKYSPIINNWRKYGFEDIEQIEIMKYNSLLEFGGWGIRYNFDHWLYNTGGKYGLLITTKNKKFMLGTHKPEEAQKAIEQFRKFKLEYNGS
ncbi:hypothetical protein SAMN00777080_1847 [Aquiflexum balticum DSM 16537]|uniref:PH domain-containing protein n=1 Tax=Aquiflexum balticum DSM 16537 TaxID=758820 RepID=A0A1W2H3Q1_9BACT|nr:hypothetical protein [Aquiflexum balticum]SMD43262.1 hypothetical protein SAMN00777080_1847 [Aquiflexum balticum DSM 16537]